VTLVRGTKKIIRSHGEPDLIYDLELDPAERIEIGDESLRAAVDACWDLTALDAALRLGQRRRRLVAEALARGRVACWDHPAGSRRYIDTGDDFWTALERARRP
jgi:choline-sulfatase